MKTLTHFAPERLAELIARFAALKVAVVGDFFLDKYLEVDPALAEPSVETGKVAHQVVNVRHSPGAAGTVMNNLAALGCGSLSAIGIIGDDGEGYELLQDLTALGVETRHLIRDPSRKTPTYLKPRDADRPGLEAEHSRYDTKNRTPTPAALIGRVLESIRQVLPQLDALILMDQVEEEGCGVITPAVAEAAAQLAREYPRTIFWADSRRRIRDFRNIIIKPNQFEAVGDVNAIPGREVSQQVLEREIPRLRAITGAPIFATAGARGIYVSDPELTLVPGVCVPGPVDPTGAGDSATAGCVLALAAGATPPEAALVGNLVASITVQQLATTGTARPSELPPRLALWQQQADALQESYGRTL